MLANQCRHRDREPFGRACNHLFDSQRGDHVKRFTGTGVAYDLICGLCSRELDKIDAVLVNVCDECFRAIEEAGSWEGIVGQPQVVTRQSDLLFEHEDIDLPGIGEFRILEVQPVEHLVGKWLACTSTGTILEIAPDHRSLRIMAQVPQDALDFDGPNLQGSEHALAKGPACVFRVSRNGEIVAVANRYGHKGIVLEPATGNITMRLRRDDYHEDVSSFPLAFVYHDDQLLLVHGTAWNRLDVSDARNGMLLTERGPTSYSTGQARPEHYLDYFHCSLVVSPDQQYVADNGWVWHPVGIVECWNIQRWLDENAWESEDGESKRSLCWRGYYWDGPLCWIDNHQLAVWGFGQDDEGLIPAACIFDVHSGKQERWFAGPKGSMVYDRYLFSFDKDEGMSAWDDETGERVLNEPTFCPIGYHRGSKQFISLLENGKVRISRLVQRQA